MFAPEKAYLFMRDPLVPISKPHPGFERLRRRGAASAPIRRTYLKMRLHRAPCPPSQTLPLQDS